MKELILGIRAGFGMFYLQSNEPNRAVAELTEALKKFKEEKGDEAMAEFSVWNFEENPDPSSVCEELDRMPPNSVLLAKNFNWFLQELGEPNKVIVQWLLNRIERFSTEEERKTLVIVSSDSIEKAIPACLLPHFRFVSHALPTKEEIDAMWIDFREAGKELPGWETPKDESLVVEYARGLTRAAVLNAFSLATIKGGGKINPLDIAYLRAEEIEKTPGIKIGRFGKDFSSLSGMDVMKRFVTSTVKSPLAKGVMLLGPPGVGKTHFAECLSNETGLLCIVGEMAQLMGQGLVGQAENAWARFIEVVKANAPCILFIDEIEKGLSGMSNGTGDGGTMKRSAGQFLKFLSDDAERKGIYVIATCNDISALPPEWTRAERWDGVFFIDIPNEKEKKAILDYYKKSFDVKGSTPNMDGWSGAEIKTCCRLAKMMDVGIEAAAEFVIPITRTKGAEIENLRKWANAGNCLIASEVETKYSDKGKGRRKITI